MAKIEARVLLVALYFKCHKDWNKMYDHICNKKSIPEQFIKKAERFKDNYITILDDDYPEKLKYIYEPPFVLKRRKKVK